MPQLACPLGGSKDSHCSAAQCAGQLSSSSRTRVLPKSRLGKESKKESVGSAQCTVLFDKINGLSARQKQGRVKQALIDCWGSTGFQRNVKQPLWLASRIPERAGEQLEAEWPEGEPSQGRAKLRLAQSMSQARGWMGQWLTAVGC